MFIIIFAYFLATAAFFCIIYKIKNKTSTLPALSLTKHGLVFKTTNRHKIFVGDVKFMVLERVVYLKQNNKMVILKNITKPELKKGYFYFTGLGEVNIILNCKSFYKQFNINIKSANFDLHNLKQMALNQLINNLFNINACNLVKRYLHAVNNILNITIDQQKMTIKQNKFFLPFSVTYKVNNTIKTVKVNQN